MRLSESSISSKILLALLLWGVIFSVQAATYWRIRSGEGTGYLFNDIDVAGKYYCEVFIGFDGIYNWYFDHTYEGQYGLGSVFCTLVNATDPSDTNSASAIDVLASATDAALCGTEYWNPETQTCQADPYIESCFPNEEPDAGGVCQPIAVNPLKSKEKECKDFRGNPVNVVWGEKVQIEKDYQDNSPHSPLTFTREYNNRIYFERKVKTPFNYYWRHNYARSVAYISREGGLEEFATLNRPDGKQLYFNKVSGNWIGDADTTAKLVQTASGWKVSNIGEEIEIYDTTGKLIQIQYISGVIHDLIYNAQGQLIQIADSLGRQLILTYNPDGTLATLTTPDNQVTTYSYDSNTLLSQVTYPDGTSRQYTYDSNENLTSIIDENGNTYASWQYDTTNRPISSEHAGSVDGITFGYSPTTTTATDGAGTTKTYSFTTDNHTKRIATITDSNCASCQVDYQYDPANGDLLSKTEHGVTTQYGNYNAKRQPGYQIEAVGTPEERRTDYTYDPRFLHKLSTIAEPSVYAGAQKVTTYQYDDFGNTTAITVSGFAPDGTPISRTTTMQYNGPLNQLSQIDGPRTDVQDITTFEYYPDDPAEGYNRARLKRVTNPLSHVLRDNLQYTATGKLASETRLNDISLSYTYYAGNDRLETLTETDVDGVISYTTRWTYLPSGETASITRAYGTPEATTIQFGYDTARRLTTITDGLGNRIEYTLDSEGNKTGESIYDNQDVLRKTLAQTFDVYNRLDVFNQANEQQDYDYNPDGTLDKVTDGTLNVMQYTYDNLQRLTTTTQDTNIITQYGYDAADRLTTVTDPNNNATSYSYDDLGNLISQTSPDTGTTTFSYDEAGNLAQKTDAKGQVFTYTYDDANRIVEVNGPDPTDHKRYVYDLNYPGGIGRLCLVENGEYGDFTTYKFSRVWYAHDSLGRMNVYDYAIGRNETYLGRMLEYDDAGRVNLIHLVGRDFLADVGYQYDAAGRVSRMELIYQGQSIILADNIQYTPFGGVTDLTYDNGLTLSQTLDSAYRYTAHNVDSRTLELTNTYDANGNIIQLDNALSRDTNIYSYDALRRLTGATGVGGDQYFSYDANSNRVEYSQDGIPVTYQYEPGTNRLFQAANDAVTLDANGNTIQRGDWTYTYDGDNQLIEVWNNGVLIVSYFNNLLGERVRKVVNGETTYYYYTLDGQLAHEITIDGQQQIIKQTHYFYLNGRPLAMIKGGQLYYIHNDHLGTPRAVTDSASKVVWTWNSDPFGTTPGEGNGPGAITFNLRFPGQYYDEETGLHYNYHRYYDPSTGRYLTSDPIGLQGGLNTFGYVGGDPVNYKDIYGLDYGDSKTVYVPSPAPTLPPLPEGHEWTWKLPFKLPKICLRGICEPSPFYSPDEPYHNENGEDTNVIPFPKSKTRDTTQECPPGGDNDKERCKKIKQQCIEGCSDFVLHKPRSQRKGYDGMDFHSCVKQCLDRNGC